MSAAPLVSVLLAVSNGEHYLRAAIESVLRQTISDLELIVVDDGSTDETPEILAVVDDPRLQVLRNEGRLGLAVSLNRGLDEARGRYVARLDADDIAFPQRLERQLQRMVSGSSIAVLGSAVLELDASGRSGSLHLMPAGPAAVRWAALFSSPFFHPSVLIDREVLERYGLRYDPEYLESEDYDLWTRLLTHAEGDNLTDPLMLYRVHPGQASQSRGELQRAFQERVSVREIERVASKLGADRAELARRVGAGLAIEAEQLEDAACAYVDLVRAFELSLQQAVARSKPAREAASRTLARLALRASGRTRGTLLRQAAALDPLLPTRAVIRRTRRLTAARGARVEAAAWLRDLRGEGASDRRRQSEPRAIRVAAVFPEPTPYRAPLLDRVAAQPEVDLTVIYAAETVAGRTWRTDRRHRAVFLRGARLPGAREILHHDYPVTPGIAHALVAARPEVVVVSGWSTFAAQAAIVWSRVRRVPYVLVVESHDEGPRAGWRRQVKGAVVPRVVERASGVLVTGTLARRSMVARGAPPERVRVFANTIDVEEFGKQADQLASRRDELRNELGARPDDVIVLSVARLASEKGLDVLIHAVAEAEDSRLLLVLAGDGPERERLEDLAGVRGVRLTLAGDREWERIVEVYVAADAFALLSEREPWAVVVNEAAACGLPLVLSDRVGAAHDLLRDGENGFLVGAGDVDAASGALRKLAADPSLRTDFGKRSRELAQDWGYGPSVAGFLAAVREAVSDTERRPPTS
ncbi:MAG: glycosyltransferase [Actinobacteria bacterium]|nr:glycosyltransferase [Actinomycetota bacterium]